MVALNVLLLRSSLEWVLEREPDLTLRFYEVLFARYPELESLFDPSRRERQAKMLGDAIVAVVDHLEDAPWLEGNLGALGAKHVGYGVTPDMYDKVGNALLATLADAAGQGWSPALEAAWGDAYAAIAHLMLAGAAREERAAAAP